MKTRRHFLVSSAAATAAWVAPRFAIGQAGTPANSRINLAFIGVGNQAQASIHALAAENFIAFADIDDRMGADTYKKHPKVPHYRDYRELLDKHAKEIDAVVVAIPDHSHFPATMAAMELGKHVFTEKPLAHNAWQCRTMKKAARHYKIISQMGNQGHATTGIRLIREWYESGVLGAVREVEAWNSGPGFTGHDKWGGYYFGKPPEMPLPAMEIPPEMDWDLWLGSSTKKVNYHELYHPRRWRAFYDFGNGQLGDWACHTLDGPFWALNLGMPTAVEAEVRHGGSDSFVTDASVIRWEFPARGELPPVVMRWHDGGLKPKVSERWNWAPENVFEAGDGMLMAGDKAGLLTGARPDSPKLVPEDLWQEFRKNPPAPSIRRIKGGHHQEWTDAIRGEGPMPGSNFDYAADLTEMALLGVLAQRVGGRLEYDAKEMKITNRPELSDYLREPARNGWVYGANL